MTGRLSLIAAKRRIASVLAEAGIEDPLREAAYLIAAALEMDRGSLLALDELNLTEAQAERLEQFVAGRAARVPLARLVGRKEFWGLSFGLNDHTLVPRPETETLIEAVLAARPDRDAAYRLLDLGTGSGCILLSLLYEYRNASGIGIDLAPEAVLQARANGAALNLAERASFQTSNWCNGLMEKFDIIVSNPPYIAGVERAALMPEVRDHDPAQALFAGSDGLTAYRALIPQTLGQLKPGGLLALELGAGQAAHVIAFVEAAQPGSMVAVIPDLAGVGRALTVAKA